jgi:hypothetical protein
MWEEVHFYTSLNIPHKYASLTNLLNQPPANSMTNIYKNGGVNAT